MRKVFYSWQSDIPIYRSQIQKSLELAAKQIGDIQILTASGDSSGAFRIDSKILEKIDESEMYVADLSIVGNLGKRRKSPNPNVVYETGYAHKKVGEERMFLIANKESFGTEKFPFDIRNRRLALYNLSSREAVSELTHDLSNFFEVQQSEPSSYSEMDIYAEQTSISGDGTIGLNFVNEENEPYYLETASIDGHKMFFSHLLKGKDTARLHGKLPEYPFIKRPQNFSFIVVRHKKRYQIHQRIESSGRADERYNIDRIIPDIESVTLLQ